MDGGTCTSPRAAAARARTKGTFGGSTCPAGLYGSPICVSRWRRRIGRVATILLAGTGISYLVWRAGGLGGAGPAAHAFYAVELATLLFSILTGTLLWNVAPRKVISRAPCGSLDVFVPVCGEPPELVEGTIQAALGIDYPHTTWVLNDGRLRNKPGWEAIEELAARYEVRCLTRASGPPGKAANMNHALGWAQGDFIAVVDADHRAHPRFAHETLGYFADPRLAFVCTPQQFDVDPRDRLGNRELFFYRCMQPAKDRANAAFSCGNASVYRRSALDSIGGFSEWGLVEDLHTSYRLHASGWTSAYHPHAVTTGKAPETPAAFLKQRLTWATDSLRILLWDSPLWKRGLTMRQRLHYLHTTTFYLVAACFLAFLAAPPLQLLFGISVLPMSSTRAYVLMAGPYVAATGLFLVSYAGVHGGVRSARSSLLLAPVCALALVRAATRKRFASGVTPKVCPPVLSALVVPHYVALAVSALAISLALAAADPADAVSGLWSVWILIALSPAARVSRSARAASRPLRLAFRVATGMVVIVAASVLGPRALGGGTSPVVALDRVLGDRYSLGTDRQTDAQPRRERLLPPRSGVYLGAYDAALAADASRVKSWNARFQTRLRIVNRFQQWRSAARSFPAEWAAAARRHGAVPMVTWEPWAKPSSGVYAPEQHEARLALLVAGRYDAYVRKWAEAAASYGGPLLVRFMHEANGDWYPWSVRTNGNSPRLFIAAWRRVHRLFDQAGANNVSWVWDVNSFRGLPASGRRLGRFYPGADQVDWVSMTGFNWGSSYPWNTWHSFASVFDDAYRRLVRFGKPVMISELGTTATGGDQAAWVGDAVRRIRTAYPRVRAVVWFDSRYPGDPAVDFRFDARQANAFSDSAERSFYRPRLHLRHLGTQPRPKTETWLANPAPSRR
jgi:cellulose synthase (UDP-forming)